MWWSVTIAWSSPDHLRHPGMKLTFAWAVSFGKVTHDAILRSTPPFDVAP